MTAVPVPSPTEPRQLDAAVERLRQGARAWARASVAERIALARSMLAGTVRVRERLVAAACAAKGIPEGSPLAGDEWFGGPYVVVRMLRQLIGQLQLIERTGETELGPLYRTGDGRVATRVYPHGRLDAILFMGVKAEVHFEEGADEERIRSARASFYKQRQPREEVCLVLGAGNVNSIPATDVLTKMFGEGKACLLKVNPVNAYVGPLLEEAFADAIRQGFLAVAYGGSEVGSYLTGHPGIDEVHITGSDRTHDLIVWGPPGPERAERMARGRPLLRKAISSELGNVTPILVVPGPYDERQLAWQAENVAGMVTQNASFNCIAAKLLVTPGGWKERGPFLAQLERFLGLVPPRRAWYPGAEHRFRDLTEGRQAVRRIGAPTPGALPWTILPGLDPADREERAYRVEPFCSLLSEVSLGSNDPVEFLEQAVPFCNERVWGTLAATLVVHPATLRDPRTAAAVEEAIRRLRYGTVVLNLWPGVAFAMGTAPWGAAPGSPLTDIQSGRGFVHNTLMLEHVDKVVVRAPLTSMVKMPYFPSHRTADVLGRRLSALEEQGSLGALPGVLTAAFRA